MPFVTSSMERDYDVEDLAVVGIGPGAARGRRLVLAEAEMAALAAI